MGKTYRQKYLLEGEDRTGRAFGSLKRNLSGVDKALGGLSVQAMGVMGAAGVGAGVAMAIKSTAESLDSLAKRAGALGMASQDLDAWSYAAELSGVSSAGMDKALRALPQRMHDAARGSKDMQDVFARLGVSVTDNEGRLKDVTTVLLEVSDGMAGMESATERAALAGKLFGSKNVGLVNMLKGGSEGLRGMLVEAHSLGTRYGDLAIHGENFQDAQLRLNRSLRSAGDAIWSTVLPGLSNMANTISQKLVTQITGLDQEFRELLGTFQTMPPGMAMERMRGEFDMLTEKMWETGAELRRLQQDGRGYKNMADKMAGSRLGRELDSINSRRDALRKSMAALTEEMEHQAEVDEYLAAQTDDLGDSTGALTAEQKAANAITKANRTALEVYADTLAVLTEHLDAGRITQETFDRGQAAAAKVLAAGTTTRKARSEAEREGQRVTESLRTVEERHADQVARYDELLAAGTITQETHTRAVAAAAAALRDAQLAGEGLSDMQAEGQAVTRANRTALEEYNEQLAYLAELLDGGAISQETFNRAAAAAATQYEGARDSLRDLGTTGDRSMSALRSSGVSAAQAVGSALTDMSRIGRGEIKTLGDYANDVFNSIIASMIQLGIVGPLTSFIEGGGTLPTTAGPATTPSMGLGLPGRARGGSVAAGRAYLVGEHGRPEVFIPSSSGQVAPIDQAGAAGVETPAQLVINIDAVDGPSVVRALHENRGYILGLMETAHNRRGRRGPMG